MIGRIKLHLNHIEWAAVEMAASRNRPIRVTLSLTNAKGNPVMASVRPDVARWERGGSGFSDTGINGSLPGQYSNRRTEIHEKAKT
jgi:hypothetical protein